MGMKKSVFCWCVGERHSRRNLPCQILTADSHQGEAKLIYHERVAGKKNDGVTIELVSDKEKDIVREREKWERREKGRLGESEVRERVNRGSRKRKKQLTAEKWPLTNLRLISEPTVWNFLVL